MRNPELELTLKLLRRRKHDLDDILINPHMARDIGLAHLVRDPRPIKF